MNEPVRSNEIRTFIKMLAIIKLWVVQFVVMVEPLQNQAQVSRGRMLCIQPMLRLPIAWVQPNKPVINIPINYLFFF